MDFNIDDVLSFDFPTSQPVAVKKTEVEILKDKLSALQGQQDSIKSSIADDEMTITKAQIEKNRILTEAHAAVAVINDELVDTNQRVRDAKLMLREIASMIRETERELMMAIERERQKLEFKNAEIQWDEISNEMHWGLDAFPYQIDGAKLMANAKTCILGDKMGIGKTLTSIIWLDLLKVKRALIVVPADVLDKFAGEIARWAPHRVVINLYKKPKAQRDAFLQMCEYIDDYTVLVNYEAWRKDAALVDKFAKAGFQAIICDEAHSMKNVTSNAFRGVRDIVKAENCCPTCSGVKTVVSGIPYNDEYSYKRKRTECAGCGWKSTDNVQYEVKDRRSIKYVLPMTGTPILNRPQELYPLLHLILPETFPRERDYLDTFCEQDFYTKYWRFRSGGLRSLSVKLGSHFLARTREDAGIVLPNRNINVHNIEFDPELYPNQWRVINQLTTHAQIVMNSGKKLTTFAAIELILRKRQANIWPASINIKDADGNIVWSVGEEVVESIKLDKAMELMQDATADGNMELGERVVMFSQFKQPLREMSARLDTLGISNVVYDGDTSHDKRMFIQGDFDRKVCDAPGYDKKWQVVLCNYKTGGVGLDLTGATRTIISDEEWNPGKNEQAWDRTYRIGQTGETTIDILRVDRSIDTWMAEVIEYKKDVVGGFNEIGAEISEKLRSALDSGEIM